MGLISNGTTLLDAGAIDSGVPTGAMTLIKTLTASGSSTLSFVHGASSVVLDGTYKEYIFKLINIHSVDNSANMVFNLSVDSGSNYNVTKTSSAFAAWHKEDDSGTSLAYNTGNDLAQSTGVQQIDQNSGNDNDQNFCAELKLFSPSSTTFVKHYMVRSVANAASDAETDMYVAGYCNTTTAIDGVQFSFSSGNIDSGVIKLYGIS